MQNNSSRQEILDRISAAAKKRLTFVNPPSSKTEDIYKPILPDAITCFVNELEAISGQCIVCENIIIQRGTTKTNEMK